MNTPSLIRNPILPGFHPDPSIVRVGADYYIATSTFEWAPGIRLHHSRDLRHWRTLGGIADSPRLLDVHGVPDSGGVWAPDLTYANGRFHLVFSVLDNYAYGYKDCANYLITATDIAGPWTDPVRLPGRGFDAALYHDEDGGTWLLNMVMGFRGIEIQQLEDGKAIGRPELILRGSSAGITEGPHLYKKNGWYYLLCAEGGTGFNHGAIVARSRDLKGPYEVDPNGPLLTTRDKLDLDLQKAGHGCFVETEAGEWYMTYLTSRPYTEIEPSPPTDARQRDVTGRCVLGRETAVAKVEWDAGWPRIENAAPAVEVEAPALEPHPWPRADTRDDFESPELDPRWNTLRRHADPDWLSLTARPSHLRIRGGQSPHGRRTPSLVAQRVTAKQGVLEVGMEFTPETEHQSAGIAAYYNSFNWHFLQVSQKDGASWLSLVTSDRGRCTVERIAEVGPRLELRIAFEGPRLRFGYRDPHSEQQVEWIDLSEDRDATILSDEHATWVENGMLHAFGFTGAFVGLWVQDLADEGGSADFDYADYRPGALGSIRVLRAARPLPHHRSSLHRRYVRACLWQVRRVLGIRQRDHRDVLAARIPVAVLVEAQRPARAAHHLLAVEQQQVVADVPGRRRFLAPRVGDPYGAHRRHEGVVVGDRVAVGEGLPAAAHQVLEVGLEVREALRRLGAVAPAGIGPGGVQHRQVAFLDPAQDLLVGL
ncbi:glycoside hydrolase family 43 protein [Glycomyces buryatensis]|uniref:Glycoside hydrolase family 43 protein n=1 Tax=Glycomyces buryatensis TaxID=2570927 RepID=A0A4S8PZC3_9ACTN|nr:glycoside hydrolase family 43 protein [Glycomyces buryatensis]THV37020.1 glycoside hydrolase family 43 protein [Glycomyces buryatensis]